MKFSRDNGLTIVLMLVTLGCIAGMIAAGLRVENKELTSDGQGAIGVGSYILSGAFISALFENWESEFCRWGRM